MMADFRALCAELTAWAEKTSAHYFQPPDVLLRARAALAKADGPAVPQGREPASVTGQPRPVPVSERLPGPEDCDASGRCWWLHVGEDGVGDWLQRAPYPSVTSYALFRMTHWLPAHALPLPLPEVDE